MISPCHCIGALFGKAGGRKVVFSSTVPNLKTEKIYSACSMSMSKESTTCDVLPDFSHLSVPTVDHMAADVNYSVSEVMVY